MEHVYRTVPTFQKLYWIACVSEPTTPVILTMTELNTEVVSSWSLTRRTRQVSVISVLILYVLSFPGVYPLLDHFYFIVGLIPIITAGLLLGFWAAIYTVLAVSSIHFVILFGVLESPLWEAFVESFPLITLIIGGAVGYLRDMRVELARQRDELQRRNEQLDEFASIVSHDLRNPLNVATGHLRLARTDCDSEHLDAVADAHDRMATLIEDVLTLAREGDTVDETEAVELAAFTRTCWGTVETAEATLVVDTDQVIQADRSRLQQLLENLIRNAVEHGGEDVTVTVGDLQDGFYIEDTGPGIPEDKREQVFETGYSTGDTGIGFGLSIVNRVAEAHDWIVQATESSSGGARFEITGVESA